jgi:hypothetical protein
MKLRTIVFLILPTILIAAEAPTDEPIYKIIIAGRKSFADTINSKRHDDRYKARLALVIRDDEAGLFLAGISSQIEKYNNSLKPGPGITPEDWTRLQQTFQQERDQIKITMDKIGIAPYEIAPWIALYRYLVVIEHQAEISGDKSFSNTFSELSTKVYNSVFNLAQYGDIFLETTLASFPPLKRMLLIR